MAQIINEYRGLGSALGSGFGSALSELAQHKLDALKSQAGAKASIKSLTDTGVDPVSARFIYDHVPVKQRAAAIGDYFRQQDAQKNKAPQENILKQLLAPQEESPDQKQIPNVASLFNQGTTGSGINPQFLQQLLQQGQAPEPQQAEPQQQEAAAPEAAPQEAPPAHDALRRALMGGAGAEKPQDPLKLRAQDFKESQATNTFIKAIADQYHEYKNVGDIAQRAKRLLDKNIKKWPGALRGNLTGKAQELFERDPDVREYKTLSNEVITAKAKTGRGVPSRARLILEAAAKADLSQPVKTQRAIWDRLIKDAKDKQRILKDALDERDPKTGKYPLDLISRTLEKELSRDMEDFEESELNPVSQAEGPQDGTIERNKKTGQIRKYSAAKKEWVYE